MLRTERVATPNGACGQGSGPRLATPVRRRLRPKETFSLISWRPFDGMRRSGKRIGSFSELCIGLAGA